MNYAINRRGVLSGIGAAGVLIGLPSSILASNTVHEILMLNKDPNDPKKKMLFSPHLLEVNLGDIIKFVPTVMIVVGSDSGHTSPTEEQEDLLNDREAPTETPQTPAS